MNQHVRIRNGTDFEKWEYFVKSDFEWSQVDIIVDFKVKLKEGHPMTLLKGEKMTTESNDYWWTDHAFSQAITEHPGELVKIG